MQHQRSLTMLLGGTASLLSALATTGSGAPLQATRSVALVAPGASSPQRPAVFNGDFEHVSGEGYRASDPGEPVYGGFWVGAEHQIAEEGGNHYLALDAVNSTFVPPSAGPSSLFPRTTEAFAYQRSGALQEFSSGTTVAFRVRLPSPEDELWVTLCEADATTEQAEPDLGTHFYSLGDYFTTNNQLKLNGQKCKDILTTNASNLGSKLGRWLFRYKVDGGSWTSLHDCGKRAIRDTTVDDECCKAANLLSPFSRMVGTFAVIDVGPEEDTGALMLEWRSPRSGQARIMFAPRHVAEPAEPQVSDPAHYMENDVQHVVQTEWLDGGGGFSSSNAIRLGKVVLEGIEPMGTGNYSGVPMQVRTTLEKDQRIRWIAGSSGDALFRWNPVIAFEGRSVTYRIRRADHPNGPPQQTHGGGNAYDTPEGKFQELQIAATSDWTQIDALAIGELFEAKYEDAPVGPIDLVFSVPRLGGSRDSGLQGNPILTLPQAHVDDVEWRTELPAASPEDLRSVIAMELADRHANYLLTLDEETDYVKYKLMTESGVGASALPNAQSVSGNSWERIQGYFDESVFGHLSYVWSQESVPGRLSDANLYDYSYSFATGAYASKDGGKTNFSKVDLLLDIYAKTSDPDLLRQAYFASQAMLQWGVFEGSTALHPNYEDCITDKTFLTANGELATVNGQTFETKPAEFLDFHDRPGPPAQILRTYTACREFNEAHGLVEFSGLGGWLAPVRAALDRIRDTHAPGHAGYAVFGPDFMSGTQWSFGLDLAGLPLAWSLSWRRLNGILNDNFGYAAGPAIDVWSDLTGNPWLDETDGTSLTQEAQNLRAIREIVLVGDPCLGGGTPPCDAASSAQADILATGVNWLLPKWEQALSRASGLAGDSSRAFRGLLGLREAGYAGIPTSSFAPTDVDRTGSAIVDTVFSWTRAQWSDPLRENAVEVWPSGDFDSYQLFSSGPYLHDISPMQDFVQPGYSSPRPGSLLQASVGQALDVLIDRSEQASGPSQVFLQERIDDMLAWTYASIVTMTSYAKRPFGYSTWYDQLPGVDLPAGTEDRALNGLVRLLASLKRIDPGAPEPVVDISVPSLTTPSGATWRFEVRIPGGTEALARRHLRLQTRIDLWTESDTLPVTHVDHWSRSTLIPGSGAQFTAIETGTDPMTQEAFAFMDLVVPPGPGAGRFKFVMVTWSTDRGSWDADTSLQEGW